MSGVKMKEYLFSFFARQRTTCLLQLIPTLPQFSVATTVSNATRTTSKQRLHREEIKKKFWSPYSSFSSSLRTSSGARCVRSDLETAMRSGTRRFRMVGSVKRSYRYLRGSNSLNE